MLRVHAAVYGGWGGGVDIVSKALELDVMEVGWGGVGQLTEVYLIFREGQNSFEEIPQ